MEESQVESQVVPIGINVGDSFQTVQDVIDHVQKVAVVGFHPLRRSRARTVAAYNKQVSKPTSHHTVHGLLLFGFNKSMLT